ncbi:hypothetical protein [Variovorax sp. E3]|uniref:hypothetical protein n=1 Tax=Variovorax sp. E3 TaxID=1914993 RepID=UPI0027DC7F76|nr:hypothetical protein [Variovorax sp. E3]
MSIDDEKCQACWNTTNSGVGALAAKKKANSTDASNAKAAPAGSRRGLARVAMSAAATARSGQVDGMSNP